MAGVQIHGGRQILNGSIGRADLDTTNSGSSVITKILATSGTTIALSTGADAGTGDVTISTDLTYLDTKYPSLSTSRAQNTFFAGPSGSAGAATFRILTVGDVPTLNQNTTGSAATLTTTRTIWGQNFNGSANVLGTLSGVTDIIQTGNLINNFTNQKNIRNVAEYNSDSVTTGVIAIKHATLSLPTMFDVKIKIYQYSGQILSEYRLGFYKQSVNAISTSGLVARYTSTTSGTPPIIRVGFNTTGDMVILLGDNATAWSSYVRLVVEDITVSYTGQNNTTWDNGWSTELLTDTTGYVSLRTITPAITANQSDLSTLNYISKVSDDTFSGKLAPASTSVLNAGMYGNYNPANIGHVWSIGTSYSISPTGVDFGTLYGIAYKYITNTTGGNMAGGHQIVYTQGGVPSMSIGLAGDIWLKGSSLNGATPTIKILSARGSITSGGATNQIGGIGFYSNDADLPNDNTGSLVAGIYALASATHSTTLLNTDIVFQTIENTTLSEVMRITGNNRLGFGVTAPTYQIDLRGRATPASATITGTAATNMMNVAGSAGGMAGLAGATVTDGVGSEIRFTAGAGGTGSNLATTLQRGGVGGAWIGVGGAGGAANLTLVSNTGGAGGATNLVGGAGGAASGVDSPVNTGGAGSTVQIVGGVGGAATLGTVNNGGVGGAISITAGTGGVGSTLGGNGGSLTLWAGLSASAPGSAGGALIMAARNGSSTGTGGAGGAVTINTGSAGGDGTVARAAGLFSLLMGSSVGPQIGATLTVTGSSAGINPATGTIVGSNGGAVNIATGVGGTAPNAEISSTGGAGGLMTLQGNAGGVATVIGTGNNTGGKGGGITLLGGSGGTTNAATDGINTGGAGGDVIIQGGAAGNTSNPGAGTIGIPLAGSLYLRGGVGGVGGSSGGPILFQTAITTAFTTKALMTKDGFFGIGTSAGVDAENLLVVQNNNATSSQLVLRSARVGIVAGNVIGGIDFTSFDTQMTAATTPAWYATSAQIQAIAVGTHSTLIYGSDLAFFTTNVNVNSEKMRITQDGRVGIGTSNGVSRFQVNGFTAGVAAPTLGSATNSSAFMSDNSGAYGLLFGVNGATGSSWIQTQRTDGTATAYNLHLNPSGGFVNIGSGTPTTLLTIGSAATSNSGLTLTTSAHSTKLEMISHVTTLTASFRLDIVNAASTVFNSNGGQTAIGGSVPSLPRGVFITAASSGVKAQVIQGVSGQTGSLTEWQNNSGTVLASIAANGNLTVVIPTLGTTATTFLTHTSGLIQTRTAAQVLADIGALSTTTASTTYQTLANLSTDLTASATKYPSVNAVNTGLALKADDNNVVKLTGNQTVSGQKIFTDTLTITGTVGSFLSSNSSSSSLQASIQVNANIGSPNTTAVQITTLDITTTGDYQDALLSFVSPSGYKNIIGSNKNIEIRGAYPYTTVRNILYTDGRMSGTTGTNANEFVTKSYADTAATTSVWGSISGTLSSQSDLQTALNAKQDSLSGTGFVKIAGTTISYDNSTYLTTTSAASTYAPLTGAGTSGTWGISVTGNAGTVSNGVYTTGSYANPSWITSLVWSKITATPTTISGYGITDTLAQIISGFAVGANSTVTNTDSIEIAIEKIQAQINARPGTLTSISSGNGMNFTTITSTGAITMGTPSTLSLATTNAVTTTSHTHAIAFGGTALQYVRGDSTLQTLNTAAVPELTNLYFTSARVLANALTGYVVGANTALAAADTVLGAFQKVQGQINAKEPTITAGTATQYWAGNKTWVALDRTAVANIFGANTTAGTLDWNDVTNTKPGFGPTLLLGTETNGNGVALYFHVYNVEYSSKNGAGSLTQFAYPYQSTSTSGIWYRTRYSGTWSSWVRHLDTSNYNQYSPTLTGTGASGTWGIDITGNAATATNATRFGGMLGNFNSVTSSFDYVGVRIDATSGMALTDSSGLRKYVNLGDRTNWVTNNVINTVVGHLSWNKFGNNHTIWDASNGTAPNGTTISDSNSAGAWVAGYPMLVGWNGTTSYGVRVDSARIADTSTILATSRTIWGQSFNGSANITGALTSVTDITMSGSLSIDTSVFTRNPSVGIRMNFNNSNADHFVLYGGTTTPMVQLTATGTIAAQNNITAVNGFISQTTGYKSTNFTGLIGDYDTNGTTDKIIWTIGNSWNTIATMYGLGYSYTNSLYSSAHQVVFRSNGTIGSSINLSTGGATFTGAVLTAGLTSSASSFISVAANSAWGLQVYNGGSTSAHGLYVEVGASSTGIPFRVAKNGSALFTVANDGSATFSSSITASGDITAFSDIRLKKNINTIENALDKVMSLRGVTYNRKDGNDVSEKIGLIAQEVKEILPQVVQENDDYLSVSYGNIVAVLVEAVKEQQKMILNLQNQIDKL